MGQSSGQEVKCILAFIKAINQDRIQDAQQALAILSLKVYQIDLNNLINRYYVSQIAEKKIEELLMANAQLQNKIKKNQLKIIQQKKHLASKQGIADYMIQNSTMLECLFTDNLQEALNKARQHNNQNLQKIVCDLMEYKWIKQALPNPKVSGKYAKPSINIEFTMETKHIKTMTKSIRSLTNQFNFQLAHWLTNLTNFHMTTTQLSPMIFNNQMRQMMSTQSFFIRQLQEKISLQYSSFRKMIINACKKLSINAQYDKLDHTALLQLLVQSMKLHQAQDTLNQNYLKQLVKNINKKLSTIPYSDRLAFIIKEVSLKALGDFFFSIIKQLDFTKQSAKFHEELLSLVTKRKSSFSPSLMKFNVHLNVNAPYLESMKDCNFAERFSKFQANLGRLLNHSDDNQRPLTSLKHNEREIIFKNQLLSKKEIDLCEEVSVLRSQNERLKEALEEQRVLNSNFQQRLAQALQRSQTTKTAELERHFRNMIIDACKSKSIHVKFESLDPFILLSLLIQSFEAHENSISISQKDTSQQTLVKLNQQLLQRGIRKLVQSIKMVLKQKQNFVIFTIEEASLNALKDFFQRMIRVLQENFFQLSSYKEILSTIASQQQQLSSKLMKMDAQLRLRMPNLEPLTKQNIIQLVQKFQSNLDQLLNHYDGSQQLLASLKQKEEHRKSNPFQIQHEGKGKSLIEFYQPQMNVGKQSSKYINF